MHSIKSTRPLPTLPPLTSHTRAGKASYKTTSISLSSFIIQGFIWGGGGHSSPLGNSVSPLGDFNLSKLNSAHYTHTPPPPPPPKCPPTCFCPPPPLLGIFLNEPLSYIYGIIRDGRKNIERVKKLQKHFGTQLGIAPRTF